MTVRNATRITVTTGLVAFGAAGLSAEDRFELNATCLDCHEELAGSLDATPHALSTSASIAAIPVACVDCHAGWERHLDDPDASNIDNPATLSVGRTAAICATCHFTDHQLSMVEQNPHALGGVNCAGCHSVHGVGGPSLYGRSTESCFGCHDEMRAEFELTSNHRVLEGVLSCTDCHDVARQLSTPFAAGLDRQCLSCHLDMEGPYPFEHEATNAYSVEGGGCVECHHPHGSAIDRLLREPARPLCRQCHLAPGHLTAHRGLFADDNCLACHADIHGSFDNEHYFPPGVLPDDCQSSGCHPLEGE